VKLLVRPEDTHFTSNGEAGLTGHVVGHTFQGVSTTVSVRLKVLDALIDVHEVGSVEGRLETGDEVKVRIDGRHAVVEAPN
jgi:ABC-type Fe3+/spermidine/putrescine transport system ATPase subunit